MMVDVEVALFLFLFFLSTSTGFQNVSHCNGTSNGTVCLQNETDTCFGYKENLLTLADKNYLVWLHTSLRENLTNEVNGSLPKAFFMRKLNWNDDLAKMAQTWAENCSAKKASRVLFRGQHLGQLVVTSDEKSTANLTTLVGKWTAGLKSLNSEIIGKYRKPSSNEFNYEPVTQMIWWNTSELGCGRSSYKLKDCDEEVKNCTVVELVCNYFPAGNKKGEPVYITTTNKNLICQYDDKNTLCKNIGKEKGDTKKPPKRKLNKHIDRIRNKMLELWPAASGASLAWDIWDVRNLYVFFLFMTFNLYDALLRN